MIYTEDKQAICNALAETLRLTRPYRDLAYLEYDEKSDTVLAMFKNGGTRLFGVRGLSGYAMIRRLVKCIGG